MNKIKYKRKTKRIKLKYIFLILPIFLISLGIAYSKFSTNLTISGSVKGENKKYPVGDSLYTYTVTSSWPGPSGETSITIYSVELPILNLDADYTDKIEIEIEFSDGFLPEISTNNFNIYQAETITLEGNTLIVDFKEWACWVPNGSKITLYLQIPFLTESEMNILSVTLNGKMTTFIESSEFPK